MSSARPRRGRRRRLPRPGRAAQLGRGAQRSRQARPAGGGLGVDATPGGPGGATRPAGAERAAATRSGRGCGSPGRRGQPGGSRRGSAAGGGLRLGSGGRARNERAGVPRPGRGAQPGGGEMAWEVSTSSTSRWRRRATPVGDMQEARSPQGDRASRQLLRDQMLLDHLLILVTRPAPTVRPPSRIANRRPSSMAIGWISSTDMSVLSPGMTISVPSGRVTTPVTSVVRK